MSCLFCVCVYFNEMIVLHVFILMNWLYMCLFVGIKSHNTVDKALQCSKLEYLSHVCPSFLHQITLPLLLSPFWFQKTLRAWFYNTVDKALQCSKLEYLSHVCPSFLHQITLPLLLSPFWFQKTLRAWFHNRTKINWGPYGRLT